MSQSSHGKSSKRKRPSTASQSPASSYSHLPPDTINPFSRSPGQLLQFSIAGVTDRDEDPSLNIADFPHRGLDYGLQVKGVESESEGEGNQAEEHDVGKPRAVSYRERQLKVLLESIQLFLDRGDVAKAARAYGLVLQLQPHGTHIDIRHYNLWAIGAEILMREGEKPAEQNVGSMDENTQPILPKRWGSAANMGKVKAYFETLIQQHPYDYRHPRTVSALDFWLALISCEIYNAHAEHVISLACLEEESRDWDEDMDGSPRDDIEGRGQEGDSRQARLNKAKDEIRKQAHSTMRDIAGRMDNIIRDQPFSKNQDFLKLRATASLYLADLTLPIIRSSALETQKAHERREREQEVARAALEKALDLGGELDPVAKAFLGLAEEDTETLHKASVYSSLPIREG